MYANKQLLTPKKDKNLKLINLLNEISSPLTMIETAIFIIFSFSHMVGIQHS